jgi:predicted GH43/DUF377 family glycosyl hydrolase
LKSFLAIPICLALLGTWLAYPGPTPRTPLASIPPAPDCLSPGWFPSEFGLKDHTVFWHNGFYYLIATYVPPNDPSPLAQDYFVYARSSDLCSWEQLPSLLTERVPGAWDEAAVWAPHVYEEDGVFYLYYTGVTQDWTQSILLATSSEPSDPASWQKTGTVFQPDHPGSAWEAGTPADCRDPYLMKHDGQYHLYYTGLDTGGGVVGVATADTPAGPWTDMGSVVSPADGKYLESPVVLEYKQHFYLFYNLPNTGEFYRTGSNLAGFWSQAAPLFPGWAHEIWQTPDGEWMISYLTDYSVTIARLIWTEYNNMPLPTIEGTGTRIYLPLVKN